MNDNLPDDTAFFGQEFTDGILCIDNQFGKIYDYESKELWGCFYEHIDALLFFCLIKYLWNHKKIVIAKEIIVEKDEKEQFFQQYAGYLLTGLDNFFTKYFLKDNQLIYCRKISNGAYAVNHLQGEVLDSIADESLLFKS